MTEILGFTLITLPSLFGLINKPIRNEVGGVKSSPFLSYQLFPVTFLKAQIGSQNALTFSSNLFAIRL